METREEIIHAFTPAGRLTAEEQIRVMKVSNAFKDMALEVESMVPPESPDKAAILQRLLECKFSCVQAITHTRGQNANTKKDDDQEAVAQKAQGQKSEEKE